jgi:hypothetical protein
MPKNGRTLRALPQSNGTPAGILTHREDGRRSQRVGACIA